MTLTDEQKRVLAECCGLWFDDKYGRWHGEGIPQILASHGISASGLMEGLPEGAWNPLTNWNHLRLVLDALVKKVVVDPSVPLVIRLDRSGRACISCNPRERRGVGINIRSEGKDLPEAICSAALATKEK